MKNSIDTIGKRTRVLPARSAVSQLTIQPTNQPLDDIIVLLPEDDLTGRNTYKDTKGKKYDMLMLSVQ